MTAVIPLEQKYSQRSCPAQTKSFNARVALNKLVMPPRRLRVQKETLNAGHARPSCDPGRDFCISASAPALPSWSSPSGEGHSAQAVYLPVLSGSCHVRSSAGHTQSLIRGRRGSWRLVGLGLLGFFFFQLGPAGPQSSGSVSVSQWRDSGCVNRIKRDNVDLCV